MYTYASTALKTGAGVVTTKVFHLNHQLDSSDMSSILEISGLFVAYRKNLLEGNMEMKPGIESMTINENLEYEAAKKRQLWDNVRSRRSPTNYNEVDVDSFHRNKNEVVQPLIPEPIHTTPPNDDYVAPATKLILDELLEEFGDEILNVTMVDEEADFNPTKDLEELERLLAMIPQSNFTGIQGYYNKETGSEVFLPDNCVPYRLCTCGGAWILNKLRGSIANQASWMLYRWLVMLPVMMDVALRKRLGALLRACCLFISSSKSRGLHLDSSGEAYYPDQAYDRILAMTEQLSDHQN
ncbi:hypothetical protein Tco_0150849 [Tanacetum coccineum]